MREYTQTYTHEKAIKEFAVGERVRPEPRSGLPPGVYVVSSYSAPIAQDPRDYGTVFVEGESVGFDAMYFNLSEDSDDG